MKLDQSRISKNSNYEQCSVLLISAFFCVTGQKPDDVSIRKSIENLLIDLAKAEKIVIPTNIIQLFPTI